MSIQTQPEAMKTGYDLSDPKLYELVRMILWSKFAPRLVAADVCLDDTFSRVMVSMMKRNAGKNPYHPSKGGPSNYCYMVCRSVVSHQLDRKARWNEMFVQGTEEDLGWTRDDPWDDDDE